MKTVCYLLRMYLQKNVHPVAFQRGCAWFWESVTSQFSHHAHQDPELRYLPWCLQNAD